MNVHYVLNIYKISRNIQRTGATRYSFTPPHFEKSNVAIHYDTVFYVIHYDTEHYSGHYMGPIFDEVIHIY